MFGGLEALRGVNLSLQAGRIYGLIGPNGAGKTTLFNVVTGFSRATSGTVRFDGQPITHLAPHRITHLGIARTYQLVRPFFELTADQNVEVGIAYGRPAGSRAPDHVRAEAMTFLDLVGLGDKWDRTPEELNIGERKRLEIAKALAAQPRLLLFDEALAGLNPAQTEAAIGLFRRINEMGITIFMIEHNMQAIMAVCHYIYVLNHGDLIAEGHPQEVSSNAAVVEAYLGGTHPRLERRRPRGIHA